MDINSLHSLLQTAIPSPLLRRDVEEAIAEHTSTFTAELRTLRADLETARHDEFCSRRICETAVSSKKSLERQLEVERARVVPSVHELMERNARLEAEVAELRTEVVRPCLLQMRVRELKQELDGLSLRYSQANVKVNRLDHLYTPLVAALDQLYPRDTVERRRIEWLRTHENLSYFDALDPSCDGPNAEDIEDGGGDDDRSVRRRATDDDDDDMLVDHEEARETAAMLGFP